MHIEPLERRRLLAATLADGVLTITGDAANNHVTVRYKAGGSDSTDDDMLIVTERTETAPPDSPDPATKRQTRRLRRGPRLGPATRTEFSATAVTSVAMNLAAGDDHASIARNVTEAATINGGEGNDTLVGGGGASTLNGDAGDDRITAGSGATTANGGAGNDRLQAGPTSATLNGGDGADHLSGGPAPDALNGDAGNDTIRSTGGGKDTIDGGTDALEGGEAGDIAHVDATTETDEGSGRVREADVVSNVEAIRSGRRRGGWGWWEELVTVDRPLSPIIEAADKSHRGDAENAENTQKQPIL
jgi:Ca2+-binding RTX toxin-like protein